MAHHNIIEPPLSENIEMYLVRVAQLRQDAQPVPISQLAQELAVTSVSANEMCRKLMEKGLVAYEPYKGVTLTADGDALARRVLRSRALWTTFFTDALGLSPAAADDIACRFEHVTPNDVAERLEAYLAHGSFDSRSTDEQTNTTPLFCLDDLHPGQQGEIAALSTDAVTTGFFRQHALIPGTEITMLAVGSNGTLLIEVAGRTLSLAPVVGQAIKVIKLKKQAT